MTCTARRHGTVYAYRLGCRCAEAVERNRAKNRRQHPPGILIQAPRDRSQYVDEIAVERACLGERVGLTVRERAVAVARLTREGLSARAISARLGMAARTVVRYRTGRIQHGRDAA